MIEQANKIQPIGKKRFGYDEFDIYASTDGYEYINYKGLILTLARADENSGGILQQAKDRKELVITMYNDAFIIAAPNQKPEDVKDFYLANIGKRHLRRIITFVDVNSLQWADETPVITPYSENYYTELRTLKYKGDAALTVFTDLIPNSGEIEIAAVATLAENSSQKGCIITQTKNFVNGVVDEDMISYTYTFAGREVNTYALSIWEPKPELPPLRPGKEYMFNADGTIGEGVIINGRRGTDRSNILEFPGADNQPSRSA